VSRADPQPQPDLGESAGLPITLMVSPTTVMLMGETPSFSAFLFNFSTFSLSHPKLRSGIS